MTVETENKRDDYNGNGVTTIFAINFPFLEQKHLIVYYTEEGETPVVWELGSDYTIDQLEDKTGTLIADTAPIIDSTLAILRDIPFTQTSDYVENIVFPAELLENNLDKLTMIILQITEELIRTVRFDPSAPTGNAQLPFPEANRVLMWDPLGVNLINALVDFASVEVLAAEAAASAAAAEASADETEISADAAAISAAEAAAAAASIEHISSYYQNLIINGGFNVWQHGNDWEDPDSQYLADRWLCNAGETPGVGALRTVISDTSFFTDSNIYPSNPENALIFQIDENPNDVYASIEQRIWDVHRLNNEQVTVSFLAQSSTASKIGVIGYRYRGHGLDPAAIEEEFHYEVIQLTTDFITYSFSMNIPDSESVDLGTESYIALKFMFSGNAAYDIPGKLLGLPAQISTTQLTNVQVEKGDTATVYNKLPSITEFLNCQEYFATTFTKEDAKQRNYGASKGRRETHLDNRIDDGETMIMQGENFPVTLRMPSPRLTYYAYSSIEPEGYKKNVVRYRGDNYTVYPDPTIVSDTRPGRIVNDSGLPLVPTVDYELNWVWCHYQVDAEVYKETE